MTWKALTATAILTASAVVGIGVQSERSVAAQNSIEMPVYEVDPSFPPKLPNNWVMGQVPGIAVDRHDHVWILHRPRTIAEDQRANAAPAVLEFDRNGKFLGAWGGPGSGFDWPDSEHGIFVDHRDNVWIGGSSPTSQSLTTRSDDMLLKFTNKGKFLLQIGGPDKSGGNKDTASVNKPADAFVYEKTNEVFVADGYGNRRIVVFDADTGRFKRMWGAFSNVPVDAPPQPARAGGAAGATGAAGAARAGGGGRGAAPPLETTGDGPQQFGGPVHAVEISNDGLVYVADRSNRRVQVFSIDGKYRTQAFVNRAGPSTSSAAGLALSQDKAQRFLFVVDFGNHHIVVLDRKSLTTLYQFGTNGEKPGEFRNPHHMAIDSRGTIYTVEVVPGNRAQKFRYKGLSTQRPPNAVTQ